MVRYEADDETGFKANVTFSGPSGSAYLFQNRFSGHLHGPLTTARFLQICTAI
jgi:hypothetical protein